MSYFAISQVLVGIAIGFDLLSFQFKQRRQIIACLIFSCLLIAVHFALLGHWTATGLAALAAVRFLASYHTTARPVMFFFIGATVLVAGLTFQGLLSVLSCLGAVFGTISTFSRDDRRLREIMLIGTSLWLVHNIIARTPTAVLMEALFIGSNLLGYYRFYYRRAGKGWGWGKGAGAGGNSADR
ncbi:MAG: YgjV family protein [Desulfobulbus sp.]|nr:YgjV family protein [Desulfobulbus sp.]